MCIYFFSTLCIYSTGLKFLQVIYESFDCDLTQDFLLLVSIHVIKNMGGSPGELSEELVTQGKRKKGWRMNCDVDEATEGLENHLTKVPGNSGSLQVVKWLLHNKPTLNFHELVKCSAQ